MSSAPAVWERVSPAIVHLVGDADLPARATVRRQLDTALRLHRPIVVDLGDCTFLDSAIVELLVQSSRTARERRLGFALALPFSAHALVRRVLLEVLPEETRLQISPSVRAACSLLEGSPVQYTPGSRLDALRASLWENAARFGELNAERDALRLELRRTRERRPRRSV